MALPSDALVLFGVTVVAINGKDVADTAALVAQTAALSRGTRAQFEVLLGVSHCPSASNWGDPRPRTGVESRANLMLLGVR